MRYQTLLVLPVPPPLNKRIAIVNNRMVKTEENRVYVELVHAMCLKEKVRPMTGDVWVEITWYREAKRGDIDGRLKALLDALSGYAYLDDKQVSDLRIRRLDTEPRSPRMVITLTEEAASEKQT